MIRLGLVLASGLVAANADASSGRLLLALVLLCCSALFSASETALFSLQPIARQALVGAGAHRLDRLLNDPRRTLATLLIGNETINVLLSTVTAGIVLAWAPGRPWINILVLTPILLVFGEVMPKVLALRYNRRVAPIAAPLLWFFGIGVAPARILLSWLAERALVLTGGSAAPKQAALREAQLRELLAQGSRSGSIGAMELEMIDNFFEFGDLTVNRLMTPRPDVFSVNLSMPWAELVETVRAQSYSRVPVWQGSPDNIVGILLVKKLLPLLLVSREEGVSTPSPRQLKKLLLPAHFVPTNKRAEEMLDEFRANRSHMAVVVDEHGNVMGVVTLDDLLAELVGELLDEDDDTSEEVTRLGERTYTVSGSMDIDDFDEHFTVELPEGEYHTLGGFLLSAMGKVPDKGAELDWGGLRFTVSGVEGRRVTEVCIERLQAPTEAGK